MAAMAEVVLDRMLTESEWDALRDPDGGRYEILDGRLVMSPSSNADHNDLNVDLVMMVRELIRTAGLDLRVTTDVEWRTVAGDVVLQAPRGDLVVGTVDAIRRIHNALPLLVAEVWSADTRPGVIESKRSYWRSLGLEHYWEIVLGETAADTALSIWELAHNRVPLRARGHDRLSIAEPFSLEIAPAELHGWADARARRLEQRSDELEERGRESEERARELEERARELEERARESEERARELEADNARLAQRLREIGDGD